MTRYIIYYKILTREQLEEKVQYFKQVTVRGYVEKKCLVKEQF